MESNKTTVQGDSQHGLSRPESPARIRLAQKYFNYLTKKAIKVPTMQPGTPEDAADGNPSFYSLKVTRFTMVDRLHTSLPQSLISFEEFCVRFIERWWYQQRSNHNSLYSMTSDELKDTPSEGSLTRDRAARVIQRCWRRHIDIQVYHYYRDLIKFYSRGNPKLMLRCINPKEANILDFAAGIHIRFRLAGEKFPPNIYYKIFTYRPVTDVNSFAPRDYTVSSCAVPSATVKNSKIANPNGIEDLGRWYQRQENNGWRLVSDRIFTSNDTDMVLQTANNDRKFFHFSRLRRQKDIDTKRKIRKRQWLADMYKEGRDNEREPEESDIDEMVAWCDDLDFDNYVNNWLELATAVTLPASEYSKFDDRTAETSPI